jgi:HAD superfamily hydrolase (TIGR01509 family)
MPLLIFDCDGVLVDSEPIACAAFAHLMTSLGHTMTTEDVVRAFGGRSLADVIKGAEQRLGRPVPPDVWAQAGRDLLDRFRRELKPIAGVRDAIAGLDYPRCVASSSQPERIDLSLTVTGLAPLFTGHVFSAVQVKNGKPAPDLFLFAAERMGQAPADAVVIEDSVLGVRAAGAAGMRAIGFVGGGHATAQLASELTAAGASTIVTAMAGLPAAVETLLGRSGKRPQVARSC